MTAAAGAGALAAGAPPPKLVIRGLAKTYAGRGDAVHALSGVDLDVPAGGFVSLVGTSGCGKSTLLNIVAGLDRPTAGTVQIDGDDIVGPGPDRGVVFQSYSLFPWRTVAANVAFGLECLRLGRGERRRRVADMLGVVGLRCGATGGSSTSRTRPTTCSASPADDPALRRASAGPTPLAPGSPAGSADDGSGGDQELRP